MTNPNLTIPSNRSRYLVAPQNILRFPNEDIPYKMLLTFKEYSYTPISSLVNASDNASKLSVVNSKGSIILPLPLQLNDSTHVKAANADSVAAAITKMALDKASGQGADTMTLDNLALFTNMISSALGGIADVASKFEGGGTIAGVAKAAQGAVGIAASDTAQILGGLAINPFTTMQFKGVDLKTHTFNWKLSPSTASESDTLRSIINTIKSNILPAYTDDNTTNAHALLKYPAIAYISFYGINQDYYYNLKPAMVTSFNVKYNSEDHLTVYRGGKPIVVDISMNLTELTIHTSSDYGGPTYSVSALNPFISEVGEAGSALVEGFVEKVKGFF